MRCRIIIIAIWLIILAHALTHIYEVPEDVEAVFKYKGFIPKNPNIVWFRVTLYGFISLYAYRNLLRNGKVLIDLIVYSLSLMSMCNELAQENESWSMWLWFGFVVTVLFSVYEYFKYKKIKSG